MNGLRNERAHHDFTGVDGDRVRLYTPTIHTAPGPRFLSLLLLLVGQFTKEAQLPSACPASRMFGAGVVSSWVWRNRCLKWAKNVLLTFALENNGQD